MLQAKHWLVSPRLLCILFIGLCAASAAGQGCPTGPAETISPPPTSRGPVRLTLTSAVSASTLIPQGCTVKLTVFASSFRNAPPLGAAHDVSSDMVWQSSNPSVFTVNRHGLVTAGNSTGMATITATGWQGQVSIMLQAGAPVIVTIMVGPFDSSVAMSGTVNYTAIGFWSDGKTTSGATGRPFPSPVIWGVMNSIGGSSGLASIVSTGIATATATGNTAGIVEITATYTTVTGGTYLNIGLTGIIITATPPNPSPPPDASVPKGDTQTFDAMGTFSAGPSPLDLTRYVFWRSSMPSVARVNTAAPGSSVVPGVAHTFSVCQYPGCQDTISAVSGTVLSNPLILQVTPAVVNTLTIYPGCSTSVPRGITCQFEAIAIYSDNTFANLTNSSNWSSSNSSCLSITPNTGFAATMSSVANPCNANVTASYVNVNPPGNIVGSNMVGMTVNPHVLRNITIFPANPTVPKPNTQQFSVKAHYTDGTVSMDGPSCPSWSSTNSSVATIVPSTGTATSVNPGTTNIGTSCLGMQASTVMTVVPAPLTSITVTAMNRVPLNPDDGSISIPVAGTQDFMAMGHYADGSQNDITFEVNWTTSNAGVASMSDSNNPNEATGVAAGAPITIKATDPSSGINGSASLAVKAIGFITVNPSSQQNLSPGGTVSFSAVANYSGSVTQSLDNFGPAWSSNQVNIATVDQNGLATAVSGSPLVATIKAQLGSVDCTMGSGNCGSVKVSQAILQSITVTCDPSDPCTYSGSDAILHLGQSKQMIATGHYSDNSTLDVTSSAMWAPSTGNIVNVDSAGFLTTKGLGSTTVTATCTAGGGCQGATSTVIGSLPVTVTP